MITITKANVHTIRIIDDAVVVRVRSRQDHETQNQNDGIDLPRVDVVQHGHDIELSFSVDISSCSPLDDDQSADDQAAIKLATMIAVDGALYRLRAVVAGFEEVTV